MSVLVQIPKIIQDNLGTINNITLQFLTDCGVMLSETVISNKHAANVDFAIIHSSIFDNASSIIYTYTTTDNITKQIKFDDKHSAKYVFSRKAIFKKESDILKKKDKNWVFHFANPQCAIHIQENLLYYNKDTIYQNNSESITNILDILNDKYQKALNMSSVNDSKKNLIYYTIFGNKEWLELLELSLNSIYNHSKDIDVLIITSSTLKKEIKKFKVFKRLQIDFLIIEEPNNKIIASINKLLIFKYKKIHLYKRVLFLDCDILAFDDINSIFTLDLKEDKLYTVWESEYVSTLEYQAHRQMYHGLGLATDEDINNLELNKQMPFNAGQFMFIPSAQMLEHFKNVYWLSNVWPTGYFFEQSIMTYYFCYNNLTEAFLINNYFNLLSIAHRDSKLKENRTFIHFIGNSTNAQSKIDYIKKYNPINYANIS